MSTVNKMAADRNQRVLLELVGKPGNDVCADCKARSPRWASHNLGIFICMNCASIHRKIGTHITKVKSVTMDSWSKEQVEVMKNIGNLASNAKYNPNEPRHPPPANREETERDSELEKFIRWKYEFKRFMQSDKSRPTLQPHRAQTLPPASMARRASPLPPLPPPFASDSKTPSDPPSETRLPAPQLQQRATAPATFVLTQSSMSAHSAALSQPSQLSAPHPAPMAVPQPPPNPSLTPSHSVWNEIMSLATPSPPIRYQSSAQTSQAVFQQPSLILTNALASPSPSSSAPGTLQVHPASRSASLPAFGSVPGPTFQALQAQPHPHSFTQQHSGYPAQIMPSLAPFQTSSVGGTSAMEISYGQPSVSPHPQSYTPLPVFPQQQESQQIPPASFAQQFMPPGHASTQQSNHEYQRQQQQPMQAQTGNPFGQWQQQHGSSSQTQYGQWGHM